MFNNSLPAPLKRKLTKFGVVVLVTLNLPACGQLIFGDIIRLEGARGSACEDITLNAEARIPLPVDVAILRTCLGSVYETDEAAETAINNGGAPSIRVLAPRDRVIHSVEKFGRVRENYLTACAATPDNQPIKVEYERYTIDLYLMCYNSNLASSSYPNGWS